MVAIPDLKDMTNLTSLNMDNNQLTSAKFPAGFKKLMKFKTMTLSHNPITELRDNDFDNLNRGLITKVNLNNCKIQKVSNKTFLGFTNLQSITLSFNNIGKAGVQTVIESLADSSRIQSIDLSDTNIIGILPSNVFMPLNGTLLITLKLRHNILFTLLNGTFEPLTNLRILDLGYCEISEIKPGTLKPLKQLQTLNLDQCYLRGIPTPFPSSLLTLTMSNNKYLEEIKHTEFPDDFRLQSFDLSGCAIRSIRKGSFQNLKNVTFLDLSNNKLSETSIPKDAFVDMTNLTTLKLNNNNLKHLTNNVRMFNGLTALVSLDMSSNQCSEMASSILDPLVKLRTLHLENNQLNAQSSSVSWFSKLRNLRELYLSSNDIDTLTETTFQGASNVSKLVLKNNLISDWKDGTFKAFHNLYYLDLSLNSISVISESSAEDFSANLTVNLTGNAFYCWCDLIWFRKWVNTTEVKLAGLSNYVCSSPKQMQNKPLLKFDPKAIESTCEPPFWMYVIISASVAVVIAAIIGIILFRLRWKIFLQYYYLKQWCTSKSGERPPLLSDQDTEFSVTISYDPEADGTSSRWVQDKLYAKLYDGMYLNTFMDALHVPLGSTYNRQIGLVNDAMQASQFIILVLSKDYMDSAHRYCEMDCAMKQFDKARGQKTMIIVSYPDGSLNTEAKVETEIQKNALDRNEHVHVLTWRNVEANDTIFWDKLREIIPANNTNNS